MKITIAPTDRIVELNVNGAMVPARIWQGETASGIPMHCYITRVAVDKTQDAREFEQALQETTPLRPDLAVIPLRMIL
jgi:hypothetical protein